MQAILMNLANLLRLRSGPQDFSSSWRLTIVLVAAYLLQNLVTGQQLQDDSATEKSLVAMALQVFVLAGLLSWQRHMERFAQTLSALAGVGIVFNMIIWGLLSQSGPLQDQPSLVMLWFAVFVWSLFVDANIYRHALSVSLSVGMLITVLILAASYALIKMLFLG